MVGKEAAGVVVVKVSWGESVRSAVDVAIDICPLVRVRERARSERMKGAQGMPENLL